MVTEEPSGGVLLPNSFASSVLLLFAIFASCTQRRLSITDGKDSLSYGETRKEHIMLIALKLIGVLLFAGLAWLVGNYTVEYFIPYKKK